MGLFSIAVAIGIPLGIEWLKRPKLILQLGDMTDRDSPCWRIVHVRAVNSPLRGRRGWFLLRNDATGCEAHVVLRSKLGGDPVEFPGKWSSTPEPIQTVGIDGRAVEFYDPQKLPTALTCSVPPTDSGQAIAIAIKHGGDTVAYGFGPELYGESHPAPLRTPSLALPDPEYEVTVTVTAGQIERVARFVLHNRGSGRGDLELRAAKD